MRGPTVEANATVPIVPRLVLSAGVFVADLCDLSGLLDRSALRVDHSHQLVPRFDELTWRLHPEADWPIRRYRFRLWRTGRALLRNLRRPRAGSSRVPCVSHGPSEGVEAAIEGQL